MLIPFGDLMNHSPSSKFNIDMLDKSLHLKQNKIYLYQHNFNKTAKKEFTEDDIYDKKTNKLRIHCEKLFEEDLDSVPQEIKDIWSGAAPNPIKVENPYQRNLCLERFKYNMDIVEKKSGKKEKVMQEERKYDIDDEKFGK